MSNRYDEPREPKPYGFVPAVSPRTSPTVGHERLRGEGYSSGRLVYRLKALTPVFVASGSYALGGLDLDYTDEPVVRACYRVDGVPAIPGSSLKGVVRSVAEAVSPSCITVTRVDARRLPTAVQGKYLSTQEACRPDQACPACSIFGTMGRLAKVRFSDAALVRGDTHLHRLPALYRPRPEQAERTYQVDGKWAGRKFYYHGQPAEDERQPPVEVIRKGSELEGEIAFENLSDAEFGLLLFALALEPGIALKLGGGKPTCLGSVQVLPLQLELEDASRFVGAETVSVSLSQEEMVDLMVEKLTSARKGKFLLSEQRDRIRQILAFPNDRFCPGSPY